VTSVDIEVWSVGKTKFTADAEYQDPMIREAIDQRGDVAEVIADYTDSERSNISYDEYARVTGDMPGLVLFEGWLTGTPDALAQIIAALASAQGPKPAPGGLALLDAEEKYIEAERAIDDYREEVGRLTADRNSARNAVCNLLDLFGPPDERLMQRASVTRATLRRYATDAGVRLDGRAAL